MGPSPNKLYEFKYMLIAFFHADGVWYEIIYKHRHIIHTRVHCAQALHVLEDRPHRPMPKLFFT